MTEDQLNKIYDKTHGCCHICHKRLAFSNYGIHGARGSWHIEHSVPRAKGGTDHLNNLFPACISCNLEKGVCHNRVIRKKYGTTRAPFSQVKKEKIKNDNMVGGGAIGLIIGASLAGPIGGFIGALIGSEVGKDMSVKR